MNGLISYFTVVGISSHVVSTFSPGQENNSLTNRFNSTGNWTGNWTSLYFKDPDSGDSHYNENDNETTSTVDTTTSGDFGIGITDETAWTSSFPRPSWFSNLHQRPGPRPRPGKTTGQPSTTTTIIPVTDVRTLRTRVPTPASTIRSPAGVRPLRTKDPNPKATIKPATNDRPFQTTEKPQHRESSPNKFSDISNKVINTAESLLRFANKIIQNASERVKGVMERLLEGGTTIAIQQLRPGDARRLLRRLARLPEDIREKYLDPEKFAHIDVQDIRHLPTNLISALNDSSLDILLQWNTQQTEALCGHLIKITVCPKNLQRVLETGVRCTDMVDLIKRDFKRKASHSVLMMSKLRQDVPPKDWDKNDVAWIVEKFGDALTTDDIDQIPEDILAEITKNISVSNLPRKSQRRRIVKRLVAKYNSPTSWPNNFLANMGRLLEDIDVQKLVLLRSDAVEAVASSLDDAGVRKRTTRIALTKVISRGLRAAPDVERLKKLLPWLKMDVKFMNGLDVGDFLMSLKDNPDLEFTDAELAQMAERIEDHTDIIDMFTNTTDYHVIFRKFIDWFSDDFLERFPHFVIRNVLSNPGKPIKNIRKAKMLLQRYSFSGAKKDSIPPPWLFTGLSWNDIEKLPSKQILKDLPYLKDVDLPYHLGRKLTEMLFPLVVRDQRSECGDGLYKLGKLAIFLRTRFILGDRIIPISLSDDSCPYDPNELRLTKPQIYALVENIRRALNETMTEDDETPWSADVISRMGILVRGLTAADIESLPVDTELLSIIEILSQHEDILDSGQVKAIVEKIRQYFDIMNRNTLDDVDEVSVVQVGKFLQYMNSDYELPKFPKPLRKSIVRVIGQSLMQKITLKKRQKLLEFALQNKKSALTSSINEEMLMDLGSLRCGLTKDQIERLTSDAVSVHIDDLKSCPFQEQEIEALAKRALDHNINRLRAREHIATLGPMMAYIPEKDKSILDNEEFASVSEHLSAEIDERDVHLMYRRNTGFIRERTSIDEDKRKKNEKELASSLFFAMERELGVKKCHSLVRLNQTGVDFAVELGAQQLLRCIGYLDTLEWKPDTGRQIMERISTLMNFDIRDSVSVYANTSYIMESVPNLLPGLLPERIQDLSIRNLDRIFAIGTVTGLSKQQIRSGFEKWESLFFTGKSKPTYNDILALGNLLCGASKSFIMSNIDGDKISEHLDVVGRIQGCSEETLQGYAEKLVETLGEDAENWMLHDVSEMGVLLGGLPKKVLNKLTGIQIKVIEPNVISTLPAEKVKEFTVSQLYDFTENQANAVTAMQRSYMLEEQVQALGVEMDFTNGADLRFPTKISTTLLILSCLRQFLVLCI